MVVVGLTVVIAIAVGLAMGGRLRHLGAAPIHGSALVVVAAVGQFLYGVAPNAGAAVALTVASQSALLTFLWWNRWVAGALLAAIGSSANAAVIAANGAMPVSRKAILAVSRHPAELVEGRHRLLTDGDALPWLADIIPLPLLRTVVSVGDVVMAAGIGLFVIHLMRTPRRH